jgi:cell wall assembly regulator SMI1
MVRHPPAPTPQAWLDLYAAHDGEGDHWASGTFLDLKFMPLAEVHRALLEMQDHLQYADPWEPDEPDPRVQQDYPSLSLLPVFNDTIGNDIGVDLQPGPAGTSGQVMVRRHDPPVPPPSPCASAHGTLWAS